ncbi:MAG: polysaccharide biosynthesis C-terminal domain-containing protein [Eubacteriales bacterium]|nr:polysaccharide biosynthesis C-terminal domain-containing protein [Eubacteriales bacterium]
MNKIRRLGKDFGLLTLGSFSSKILNFLLVPLYTYILTTSEYGVVDIINTTVSLVYPILTLVISEAVIRFCLEKTNDKCQVWSISMLITTLGCLGMIMLSQIIILTTFKPYLVFFVLHGITMAYNSTISQFVKGNNQVKIYAIGGVINTVAVISLNIILLIVFKMGLIGYLISLVLGHMSALIFYIIALKLWRYTLPVNQLDHLLVKSMVKYSVPMIPNAISWWISDSSDKYIVQYFCGIAVNGIYAVAYKIPSMLTTISNLFIGAWQISAFEDFESDEAKEYYSKVSTEFISFILVVAGALIFMTRPLASVLFAKDFYYAWKFTPVLILAFVFSTVSSFWGTIYTAAKRTKMLFYSTMTAAIMNIALDLILTPHVGAMGAALATLISYMVICVIRIVDSRKIMKLTIDWKRVIIELLLVIVEVVIIAFDSWISIAICLSLWLLNTFINRKSLGMVFKKVLHHRQE